MGVAGNEEADRLAREGANSLPIAPEPIMGVPLARIKKEIEVWARGEYRRTWRRLRTQRHSRLFMDGPNRGRAVEALSMTRTGLKEMTALITGHGTLRKHLHTMGLVNSPLCRKCGLADETPFHLICQCCALARKRFFAFGAATIADPKAFPELTLSAMREFVSSLDLH